MFGWLPEPVPWDGRWSGGAAWYPDPPRAPSPSCPLVFQRQVAQHNFRPGFASQVFCQLLRHEHRPMLSARAAKGHHEALKPAALINAHTGVDQRLGVGKKLVKSLLPVQILDY